MLKKIAKAIKDGFKEYDEPTVDLEDCFRRSCIANDIPEGLAFILFLGSQYGNDMDEWVDCVLADEDPYDPKFFAEIENIQ